MEPFQLFGFQHITTLLVVASCSFVAFKVGGSQSRWSDRCNAVAATLFILFGTALWWYKLKDGFNWEFDLPLALCDVAFLMCLYCFFDPRPVIMTCVTYWGLGGTLQALITPDVLQAFPSTEYVLFFVGHSVIVFAVFFLLGRAPHDKLAGWPGLRVSFLGLLLYTLVAGSLDFLFGWNYGYLRAKPEGASILDVFGEWPLYVLGGLMVALVVFALLAAGLKFLPLQQERTIRE